MSLTQKFDWVTSPRNFIIMMYGRTVNSDVEKRKNSIHGCHWDNGYDHRNGGGCNNGHECDHIDGPVCILFF